MFKAWERTSAIGSSKWEEITTEQTSPLFIYFVGRQKGKKENYSTASSDSHVWKRVVIWNLIWLQQAYRPPQQKRNMISRPGVFGWTPESWANTATPPQMAKKIKCFCQERKTVESEISSEKQAENMLSGEPSQNTPSLWLRKARWTKEKRAWWIICTGRNCKLWISGGRFVRIEALYELTRSHGYEHQESVAVSSVSCFASAFAIWFQSSYKTSFLRKFSMASQDLIQQPRCIYCYKARLSILIRCPTSVFFQMNQLEDFNGLTTKERLFWTDTKWQRIRTDSSCKLACCWFHCWTAVTRNPPQRSVTPHQVGTRPQFRSLPAGVWPIWRIFMRFSRSSRFCQLVAQDGS